MEETQKKKEFVLPLSMHTSYNEFSQTMFEMLAWMELCSSIGHTTTFIVGVDGDGRTDLKFKFDEETQKVYDELRGNMLTAYKENGEFKRFNFD